ncbi:MAG: hypothetical protein WBO09_08645 [Methylocystis silviterrae]|uniref:hypothetical protein n=1 Tax=Methylocystis silviterrae TaxID=2743612 RepID=UPI003C72776C
MSKLLIFSLSAFIGLAAFNPATARTMDKQRTACERDSHKFCAADEPNAIAVERCLRTHMNELSSACKREFRAKRR